MGNREKGEVTETKTYIMSEVDSGNGKKRNPEQGGGKRNEGTNSNNTVDGDTRVRRGRRGMRMSLELSPAMLLLSNESNARKVHVISETPSYMQNRTMDNYNLASQHVDLHGMPSDKRT